MSGATAMCSALRLVCFLLPFIHCCLCCFFDDVMMNSSTTAAIKLVLLYYYLLIISYVIRLKINKQQQYWASKLIHYYHYHIYLIIIIFISFIWSTKTQHSIAPFLPWIPSLLARRSFSITLQTPYYCTLWLHEGNRCRKDKSL